MTDNKSELREKIAYKLFMAYDSGTRALKFDDIEKAEEIISLFEHSKQSEHISKDMVLMPASLTAENGAKALLIGEFSQRLPVFCPDCADLNDKENCQTCDGKGELYQDVNISWTTIREIYAMTVKELSLPSPPKPIEAEK